MASTSWAAARGNLIQRVISFQARQPSPPPPRPASQPARPAQPGSGVKWLFEPEKENSSKVLRLHLVSISSSSWAGGSTTCQCWLVIVFCRGVNIRCCPRTNQYLPHYFAQRFNFRNTWEWRESNPGQLGRMRKCYLCVMPSHPPIPGCLIPKTQIWRWTSGNATLY